MVPQSAISQSHLQRQFNELILVCVLWRGAGGFTREKRASKGAVVSLVRVDGKVSEEILGPLKQHPAITRAKLIHLS
jgi:hypothetical protein